MEPYKKCQNLLKGFVWPIDNGRLMGDAVSRCLAVLLRKLRKTARRYGYRGLKIFTSLSLRFQDFQRRKHWIVGCGNMRLITWRQEQAKPMSFVHPIRLRLSGIMRFAWGRFLIRKWLVLC